MLEPQASSGDPVLDERVGLVRTAAGLGARELRFCVSQGDRAVVLRPSAGETFRPTSRTQWEKLMRRASLSPS